MIKCCRLCRFCYCADESDLSGFNCEKNLIIKIVDLDSLHFLCYGFKFSWIKFLFGI
jgi:hypothetical protein